MSLGMQEILPDGGLASFQYEVSRLADLGRYEDAYIVHAAEGETVVPMAVFDENPRLKAMLFAQMRDMGIDPQQYIVGNELNSINPVTGQPEFFLKKIFKEAKKAIKTIAPYAGAIAAAFGAPTGWATGIGALGGLYGEGDLGGALKGGLYGYGASKLLGEQGLYGDLPGGTEKGWLPGMRAGGKGLFAQSEAWAENKADMATLDKLYAADEIDKAKYITDMKELKETQELLKTGKFPNWKDLPWYEKGAVGVAGLSGATDLLAMGEEEDDDGYLDDWWDIQPKDPWRGNFAAPGVDYTANGGIINAYDNGGPVDRHPGMDEGYQFGFQVDEDEDRQYSFDEQGLTDEAKQAFLAREGITPIAGGIAGEIPDDQTMSSDEYQEELSRRAIQSGIKRGQGIVAVYDRENGKQLVLPEDSAMKLVMQNPDRFVMVSGFEGMEDITQNKDTEYTEDKYADGGIAHLAGGSFPRMSGAIAGPGGPKDDMVPAMLSDGEFVMTADAVRNAGGGNRREGARRMYQLMNQLQGAA